MRRKRDFRMPPHFVGIFSVSETAFHPNGRSGFGKNATQRVLRPLRVIFSCFSLNFRQLRLRYPQTAAKRVKEVGFTSHGRSEGESVAKRNRFCRFSEAYPHFFKKRAFCLKPCPVRVEIAARKARSETRALPSGSCFPKSSFCNGMFLRRLSLNFSAHTL